MDDHEEDSATQGMSLYDSIKKHGVQRPVTVSRYSDGSYELSDGHHRVSSAMDIDPEMEIPVFFGITKIN
jgi:ParB-like chromosome segregation protein Spo0J